MKQLNLKWLKRKNPPKLKPIPFNDDEIRAKAHKIWLSHNGNAESAEQDWKEAIQALKAERSPIKRFCNWTGFKGKTGWDFLQLLIVPAVLSIAAFGFQQISKDNEQRLTDDRARQETLSKYLDQMSELLINKGLRKSKPSSEVFILAQARTTTALRGLNVERQNLIIEFLRSSDLLHPKNKTGLLEKIYLNGANLSKAYLYNANLSKASLYNANLSKASLDSANLSKALLFGANLSYARLSEANLSNANLIGANLSNAGLLEANLSNANLSGVNLSNAHLSRANLSNANLLGVNLNKASLYEANLIDVEYVTQAQLDQARLCKTTLPTGEISNRDCKAMQSTKY
ncbi:MAG: pentapeptide repeat-containing protein [Plectolyngbya sp. WJT66-NPBG17]|jgi:uncharacterized protein YjbI with pentapeptide repeats|nr:pentapeptide repeat-containing protein [Plectolyngbya sp. WJT66-NPBG17]